MILRECYIDCFPEWYFKMPKKGFEVPLNHWLKNDLRYLVEESTSDIILESLHIRDKKIINNWKEDFFRGKKDNSWKLWVLISYYHWAKSSKMI